MAPLSGATAVVALSHQGDVFGVAMNANVASLKIISGVGHGLLP